VKKIVMPLKKIYRKYKKGGIRKVAKYGAKRVYKRYAKGGIARVVSDVARLKALVNVEKKYIDQGYDNVVGQCNGNALATTALDITPILTQGVGVNQRTGQSIKLTSMTCYIAVNMQSAQTVPCKIRFEMWKIIGNPQTSLTNVITECYDANPITTIVDYLSVRDPNFYSDFKRIGSKTITFPGAEYAGNTLRQKTIRFNIKLNHHVRYNGATTTLTDGQMVLMAFAEAGNVSTTTVSTLPFVYGTGINTGFNYQLSNRYYYVDN